LKYFIDMLKFPELRQTPGLFRRLSPGLGALRQSSSPGDFGYRNAYIFPSGLPAANPQSAGKTALERLRTAQATGKPGVIVDFVHVATASPH